MRLRISLVGRALGVLVMICGAVASAAPNPYEIDVLINETGANAFTGQTEMQAVQLYEKLANSQGGINGTPVHFQFVQWNAATSDFRNVTKPGGAPL